MRLPRLFSARPALASLAATAVFLGSAATGFGYALEGQSWPAGPIRMQLQIAPATKPLSDGRASLNDSATDALNLWNGSILRSQFVASIAPVGFVPREGDNVNSVFTSSTVYGKSFGDVTLAVTLLGFEGTTLTEADVVINSAYHFDSYDGPLRSAGTTGTPDLHRVLLHEFGHVLGLAHPDQAGQFAEAIMDSTISDLDHLFPDDIEGAQYLYPSTGSGNTSGAVFKNIQTGKIQLNEMVYSRATGNIYAIGAKNGKGPTRLAIFNPYTLEVPEGPQFPDSPNNLAISSEGRYLYLAFVEAAGTPGRIRRLDLFTNEVDEDFPMVVPNTAGVDNSRLVASAVDLQVAPGAPDTVAVIEYYQLPLPLGTAYEAVVVYDQSQARPNTTRYTTLNSPQLQFASSPAQLLLITDQVYKLTVDSTGVSNQGSINSNSSPYTLKGIFSGGDLFNSAGQAVNPISGAVLAQVVPQSSPIISFAVNADTGRIYYVTHNSAAISAYSVPDGESLGALALPAAAWGHLVYSSLLAWGQQGVAFSCPTLRGILVANSVAFDNDPVGGGNPDVLTLQGPAVGSIAQNSGQSLQFRVRRTSSLGDPGAALTVHYTVSGTGVNGVNFRTLTGTAALPAGSSQIKLRVVPQAGSLTDGPVTVNVSLAADPAYVIAAPATATVAITP